MEQSQAETAQEARIQTEIQEPEVELAVEEEEFPEPLEPEEFFHHEPAVAPAATAPRERKSSKELHPHNEGKQLFSSKHPVARWNAAPSKDTPDVVTVIRTQPPIESRAPKNGGQMPSRQSPPQQFRRTCQAVHWN